MNLTLAVKGYRMEEKREYDIVLSFAGENRDYVDLVANLIRDSGGVCGFGDAVP